MTEQEKKLKKKESDRLYRQKNLEKLREYDRLRYPARKEQNSIRSGNWRMANKEIKKENDHLYYLKNRDKHNEFSKNYHLTHKNEIKLQKKVYEIKNSEIIKLRRHNRYLANRKSILQKQKIYKKTHRDIYNKNDRERTKNDIAFKIKNRIRLRILGAVKRQFSKKSQDTINLLGCSVEQFRSYLESIWKPGMNWENWNLFGWHIDHIIPLSSFDLTKPEEQKKAFHYTNQQPLWAKDNLVKSNKILNSFNVISPI